MRNWKRPRAAPRPQVGAKATAGRGAAAPLARRLRALLGVLFSREPSGWCSSCCVPPEGVPIPFWGADTPSPSCAALPIPAPSIAVTLKLPLLPPGATFPSRAVRLPLSHQEPVSRCDWEPAGRSLGVCFASPTRSRAGGDRGLAASCLDRQHAAPRSLPARPPPVPREGEGCRVQGTFLIPFPFLLVLDGAQETCQKGRLLAGGGPQRAAGEGLGAPSGSGERGRIRPHEGR